MDRIMEDDDDEEKPRFTLLRKTKRKSVQSHAVATDEVLTKLGSMNPRTVLLRQCNALASVGPLPPLS